MNFITLFTAVVLATYVVFTLAGGRLTPSERRWTKRDTWKWLGIAWGLQWADVATTLIWFGFFGPNAEANEVAVLLGVAAMLVIKLVLAPAFGIVSILVFGERSMAGPIRFVCFVTSLAVVSNTAGLLQMAHVILLGHRI